MRSDGYVLCPECEGDGYIDWEIGRYWDGDYRFRRETCELCGGEGWIDPSLIASDDEEEE